MKQVLIDTSEGHVAIVIAEDLIVKIFTSELSKRFGKPIHMKELSKGEKISALKAFDTLFYDKSYSKSEIRLYCFLAEGSKWWNNLIDRITQMNLSVLNVDYEVLDILKRNVNPLRLKGVNIYTIKETLQFADIIAFGNSHNKLVKNIWKNVPLEKGREPD
jgi:hypothetical protein